MCNGVYGCWAMLKIYCKLKQLTYILIDQSSFKIALRGV